MIASEHGQPAAPSQTGFGPKAPPPKFKPAPPDPPKTIEFQLRNPTAGVMLGRDKTIVKILDRPAATISFTPDPTLRYVPPPVVAREDGKQALIDVYLYRNCPGEVTVDYYTTNRTALAGMDYERTASTLLFGINETNKTITVPILDDPLAEGDEVFAIVLTNPSGATFAGPSELPVLIQDDERPVVRDATFDTRIPPDGEIEAMALQPDEKVIIGGSFFSVDGFPSRSVARLNPDGSVDRSFHPHLTGGINGPVHALQLLPDESVVVAGDFKRVQGYEMPGVARLRPDGVVDLGFRPWAIPATITALALGPGDTILMGGSSFFGAQFGRYLPDGAPDQTFSISSSGSSFGKTFWTFGLQSTGKIVAGGEFSQINGVPRLGLVRLNSDGSVDQSFEAVLTASYGTIVVQNLLVQADDKVVITGWFEQVNGVDRPWLARLNADGSLDTSFRPLPGTSANSWGFRVLVHGLNGSILVMALEPLAPDRRSNVIRLDSSGNLDTAFNPGFELPSPFSFGRTAVVQPDGRVLVAGTGIERIFGDSSGLRGLGFSTAMTNRMDEGGSLEIIIERLGDVDAEPLTATLTTQDRTAVAGQDFVAISTNVTIAPGARSATVSIPIIRDGKAELDEDFQVELSNPAQGIHVSGAPRLNVRITDNDPPSVVDRTFRAERVSAGPIAVQLDGKILVTEVHYPPISDLTSTLWRLNSDGTIDHTFQQTFLSNSIAQVAFSVDEKLLVATSTFSLTSLTRLKADGSLDDSFQAANIPWGELRGLVLRPDRKVIVATDGGIVLLNENGSANESFSLAQQISGGYLSAFAVQADGKILLRQDFGGGAFNPLSLERHLLDGSLDSSFHAPLFLEGGSVSAIASGPDGAVFMAGAFKHIYGIRLPGLAKLQANGPLDLGFDPNASLHSQEESSFVRDPEVLSISVQPDGKLLLLTYRFGLVGYPPEGPIPGDSLVLLNSDGSLDPEFQFDRVFQGRTPISAMAVQPDGNILIQSDSQLIRIFGSSHRVPRIGFTTNKFVLGEPNAMPAITVRREGDISGRASVDLRLSSGTALEGEDFAPFTTTLDLSPLEIEKSVLLPIRDDPFAEPEEACAATLTSANNATLNLATSTVTIVDDDRPGSLDFSFNPELSAPDPKTGRYVNNVGILENGTIVVDVTRSVNFGQSSGRAIVFLSADGSVVAEFSGANSPFTLVGLAGMVGPDVYVWAYEGNEVRLLRVTAQGTVRSTISIAGYLFPGDLSVLPLPDESLLAYGSVVRHLLPDGSWDETFSSRLGFELHVSTAVLDSAQRVLLGGSFASTKGFTNAIARVSLDGQLDLDFSSRTMVTLGRETGWIYAIAQQADGRILIGGDFDACNGVPRRRLARLNADGSLDTGYDPGPFLPTVGLGEIRRVLVQADGKALLAFQAYSGNGPASPCVRLNADGSIDQDFDVLANSIGSIALQPNGQILVAGDLSNGIARPGLARLNGDTPLRIYSLTRDTTGDSRITVAVSGGKPYILDRSVDLRAWFPVTTNLANSPRLELKDDTGPDAVQRIYRVRQGP